MRNTRPERGCDLITLPSAQPAWVMLPDSWSLNESQFFGFSANLHVVAIELTPQKNKQIGRSCPWTSPAAVPAADPDPENPPSHMIGRIFRVLTRNEEWKPPVAESKRVLEPHVDLSPTFAALLNYHDMLFLLENIHLTKGMLYLGLCQLFSLVALTNLGHISKARQLVTVMCGINGQSPAMDTAPEAPDAAVRSGNSVQSANALCKLTNFRLQSQPHLCVSMHCIEWLTQILWFLGFQVSWCYQTCKSYDSPTADHSSRPHRSPNSGVFAFEMLP